MQTAARKREIDDKLITAQFTSDFVNELFRSLRTKIMLGLHESPDNSLAVTSLDIGAGKSTIAANIAITLAQNGTRTILVDGDMRRGVLHNSFVLPKSPGLSDFLVTREDVSWENVQSVVQQTHVPNLLVISSGKNVANASELLMTQRFRTMKEELAGHFEMIIMDFPPLGAVTDAVVVHELFSRYLLVARAGATNIPDLNAKIEEFPPVKKKLLGVVLNEAIVDRKMSYYKHSHYQY